MPSEIADKLRQRLALGHSKTEGGSRIYLQQVSVEPGLHTALTPLLLPQVARCRFQEVLVNATLRDRVGLPPEPAPGPSSPPKWPRRENDGRRPRMTRPDRVRVLPVGMVPCRGLMKPMVVAVGFRFQRRVKLAPGMSLNLSKSGLGVSVGPRGLKVGAGPRGIHRSVGLPGTGLHYRDQGKYRAGPRQAGVANSSAPAARTGGTEVALVLEEDGSVSTVLADGTPAPAELIKAIQSQHPERVAGFLERAAHAFNEGIEDILEVHLTTPAPTPTARYIEQPFPEPPPKSPILRRAGCLGSVIPAWRRRVEQGNRQRVESYEQDRAAWDERLANHTAAAIERRRVHEDAARGDVDAMSEVLSSQLQELAWPRETVASFRVSDDGRTLWLDVDLPEVEDIPSRHATPSPRALRLVVKEKSKTAVRRDYMRHVHGVLFRLTGEAFHRLVVIESVVVSGYSKRVDPSTGHIRDDYLISAAIPRARWSELNFQALDSVDVVASFERFDLRRDMTKTGIFRPVRPHFEDLG